MYFKIMRLHISSNYLSRRVFPFTGVREIEINYQCLFDKKKAGEIRLASIGYTFKKYVFILYPLIKNNVNYILLPYSTQ